jgi:hypothetical protein
VRNSSKRPGGGRVGDTLYLLISAASSMLAGLEGEVGYM